MSGARLVVETSAASSAWGTSTRSRRSWGNSAEIAVATVAQGSKDHDRFPGVVFVMGPPGTAAGVLVNEIEQREIPHRGVGVTDAIRIGHANAGS